MKNIEVIKCAETLRNKFYRVVFETENMKYTTDGWLNYNQA